jgi:protease I
MPDITGKKVAILATNGFEESELLEPKRMLEEAGAHTEVVAPQTGEIKGWKDGNWAQAIQVDKTLEECSAEDYDGLLIPGGTMNPDKLRLERSAVEFVRKFAE